MLNDVPHNKGVLVFGNGLGGGIQKADRGDRYEGEVGARRSASWRCRTARTASSCLALLVSACAVPALTGRQASRLLMCSFSRARAVRCAV